MLAHLDAEIGRLTDYLQRTGRLGETLLLFTSDNGAAYEGEVGPFKGGKTDLHEGGLRVPFIAVWPGRIPAGAISRQRGHHVDLLPTICEAAGVAVGNLPIDGISLLSNLTQGVPLERGTLFWQIDVYERLQRHYPKPKPTATVAVAQGPYKLLLNERHAPVELFQLENDPWENRNLLDEHPEKVRELLGIAHRILSEPRDNPVKPIDPPRAL
jgi:N-acetylgalactosamine-6-sulfatase